MKKRLLSVLLLLALVTPVAGTLGWLRVEQARVRRAVKQKMLAGMEREQLVLIRLTREASETLLKWEHEGEFEYQGHMYDVVETRTEGDVVSYWCWPDQEETRLYEELEARTARALKNDPQRERSQDQMVQFFKTLFFLAQAPFRFPAPPVTRPSRALHNGYQAPGPAVPNPPPDFC